MGHRHSLADDCALHRPCLDGDPRIYLLPPRGGSVQLGWARAQTKTVRKVGAVVHARNDITELYATGGLLMSLMGVVIVTYNSADHIVECLQSLMSSDDAPRLRIVVVDNASADDTIKTILDWNPDLLTQDLPDTRLSKPVTLIRQTENGGFAKGVNVGLTILRRDPEIDRFWLLNPDTITPAHTPGRLMNVPAIFGLLGNRICYADGSHRIQLDAGQIDARTGVTRNLNIGEDTRITPPPATSDFDFISGASLIVSRAFIDAAGLMPEDYFLYYEEVDWAMRRGDLPLAFCDHAEVYHIAGASIGSPSLDRAASYTSHYHKHRSRMIFLRRWYPRSVPLGLLFGLLKSGQVALQQDWRAAMAILMGQFGLGYPFKQGNQPAISASSDRSVS